MASSYIVKVSAEQMNNIMDGLNIRIASMYKEIDRASDETYIRDLTNVLNSLIETRTELKLQMKKDR